MNRRLTLLAGTLLSGFVQTYSQVTLQPWIEVYGSTNGQQLGKNVAGLVPGSNLPYRAAVSKVGSTALYELDDSTQTTPQMVLPGENLLSGDLNNDGYVDIVVGKTVSGYDTVFIYWGTITGIDTVNPLRIGGENRYDRLTTGLIGDINNDGSGDLVLVARSYPNLGGYGKLYVFLNPVTSSIADATIGGDSLDPGLGWSVSMGDLNNDAFNDLVVRGVNQEGSISQRYDYVNIYWGVGIDTLHLTIGLKMRTAYIGRSGLAIFDANGDGNDDLIWTTEDALSDWINVHFGRAAFDTIPDLQLENPGVGTFGFIITNGGDMNGDGYNEAVVGCPDASITSGIVLVYGGGPNIDGFVDAAVSRGSAAYFGNGVSSLGDITGDGLSDIIVGAPRDPFFPPQQYEKGYWGVFKGDSTIAVTDVSDNQDVPEGFTLDRAYPNPFNPMVTIDYTLASEVDVTLAVFDELGRELVTLVNKEQLPGKYNVQFDGTPYASGVYYYRMTVQTKQGTVFTNTKQMILIK